MVFHNGGYFLFGGQNNWATTLSRIAHFGLSSREWSFVGNLIEKRTNLGAIFYDKSFLIIGGQSGTNSYFTHFNLIL